VIVEVEMWRVIELVETYAGSNGVETVRRGEGASGTIDVEQER